MINSGLGNEKCVVLSGAGMSADSGLQTFRDRDGLWEGVRVEDVCTPQAYARNPERVLAFYNERRRQAAAAQPNAGHAALAKLADYYDVRIVTQNVDDLHERAGSRHVLHLHGELNKLRSCLDEEYVIDWRGNQSVDMTDGNGYPMRPHIVWFGENACVRRGGGACPAGGCGDGGRYVAESVSGGFAAQLCVSGCRAVCC